MTQSAAQNDMETVRQVVAAAEDEGLTLRAFGGVAVALRCPSAIEPPFAREYHDLDFFGYSRESKEVAALFERLGYEPEPRFNALNGHKRLMFHLQDGQDVDVVFDQLEMCHRLDLREDLAAEPLTLSLADLLISKLQAITGVRKDLCDGLAIIADHPLSDDGIDLARIRTLCSHDWGLNRTVEINIERLVELTSELPERQRNVTRGRLTHLSEELQSAPKSRSWKMRARLGDRVKWYKEPEEVG
jgi:hypothetical protein